MRYDDVIIVIPARYNSTRLPGKSLADINGLPMVVRVMKISESINLCDVIVATESEKVVDVVRKYNGKVILTSDDLKSGTDRVFQALNCLGKQYKYVINLQGDMPNIDANIIKNIIELLRMKNNADIVTAVYRIKDQSWRQKTQCVKAVLAYNEKENFHKCLYFSRADIPYGESDAFAHLGIYGYKIDSLHKFVSLKVSLLEKSEKLEQLRALENGMSIYATVVDSFPISVDVAEDLENARKYIK